MAHRLDFDLPLAITIDQLFKYFLAVREYFKPYSQSRVSDFNAFYRKTKLSLRHSDRHGWLARVFFLFESKDPTWYWYVGFSVFECLRRFFLFPKSFSFFAPDAGLVRHVRRRSTVIRE